MKYFPTLKRVNLEEYAADSEFEKYTSIVLDKEDNAFKVVTGQFHDKRDAYEKLSARGMIVRKTFESSIWDWIEENAPNNLTAYLMFSTAFSKWKGNNMLNDYYVKLLNDIPALNREKIKGDPNSMGVDTVKRESVELTEVKPSDPHYIPNEKGKADSHKLSRGEKLFNIDVDRWLDQYTRLKNVRVTPRNQNGTLSKLATPLTIKDTYTDVKAASSDFSEESFIDPDFLKAIFNKVYIRHSGEAFPEWAPFKSYEIQVDNKPVCDITKVRLSELLKSAMAKEKEALDSIIAGEKTPNIATDDSAIENIKKHYKDAIAKGNTAEITRLGKLLKDTQRAKVKEPGNALDMANYKATKEVRKGLKALSTALINKDNSYTLDDLNKVIQDKLESIRKTLNSANAFEEISMYYTDLQKTQSILMNAINELTKDSHLQENIRQLFNKLKDSETKILERGISSKDAVSADYAIRSLDTDAQARAQHQADLYSDPMTSPSNPIRGGDTSSRFINKLDPYIQRKIHKMTGGHINPNATGELSSTKEAYVNDGASSVYMTQPKQPPQTVTGSPVSLSGTLTEEDKQFNPALFDGYHLKPEVRDALLKVAVTFKDKLDVELEPVDVYLTGSNANYNYNDASDIDLHLVYDYEQVGVAAEIFRRYLIAQKKVFNSDYDIFVKGIKVEVGAEDINNPLVAGGVYSVLTDEWLILPEQMPEMTDELPPYINELINEIEQAIQSHDSEKIGNLWKSLGELRKASLADEGEFGSGNLMFKKLRADGYLERLKQAYYDSASQELSLESLEEI